MTGPGALVLGMEAEGPGLIQPGEGLARGAPTAAFGACEGLLGTWSWAFLSGAWWDSEGQER